MRRRSAFTLVEILIVVVILGIIATVVIGLVSNATRDAGESSLRDNLRTMRSSLQLYLAEHGSYPTAGSFESQMTQFTDASGGTSATRTTTHVYGPYILRMPPLPVGTNKGEADITSITYATGFGWGYDPSTGQFRANCADAETDDDGIAYNTY